MKTALTVMMLAVVAQASEALAREREIEAYLAYLPDGDEEKTAELDTVHVTATRSPTDPFETPAATDEVSREQLDRRSYRTTPQILRDTPGVLLQETAAGQGSPFIRGFTGFRTLFLVDGIRLNNSVFRSGPNQYWNTVDSSSIERFEVVRGPASVLFGSDAIGGAVQAITRSPYTYNGQFDWGGRLFYRGSTAENSHAGRVEISVGLEEKTGALVGLTGKTFGDLVAGEDVGTQTNVGYDEWDGDVKVEHFLDDDTRIVGAYQHVRQNNVPRTHRTTAAISFHGSTVGSELQRDLDQERYLIYLQFHKENIGGFFDAVHASISYHAQEETRDRIRPPSTMGGALRRDKQGFDVGTIGLWAQFEHATSVGRITWGIEFYHDDVDSFSTSNPVQGPVADDATYDLFGLFIQDVIPAGKRVEVIVGVRLTHAAADADRVSDPTTGAPISLSDDWTSVVGSVRVLYRVVPEKWNAFAGVSQGFRAPNLSDLTRFTSARSNEFEVPAPGLDPEFYTTFEIGLKSRGRLFAVEITTYYTLVDDQILRFPTGAMNMDGDVEVTKDNVGDGWVYGIELAGSVEVVTNWTVFGTLTYMQGKIDTFPTSAPVIASEYITRLLPLFGQAGVRWEDRERRFWAECQVVFAVKADSLSTRDQGDTQRIPPGGTPGYGVVHVRGGFNITDQAAVILAVENIFDKTYRVHGSGITMPGTNVVASISFDF